MGHTIEPSSDTPELACTVLQVVASDDALQELPHTIPVELRTSLSELRRKLQLGISPARAARIIRNVDWQNHAYIELAIEGLIAASRNESPGALRAWLRVYNALSVVNPWFSEELLAQAEKSGRMRLAYVLATELEALDRPVLESRLRRLARIAFGLGDFGSAAIWLATLNREFPESADWLALARCLTNASEPEQACRALERVDTEIAERHLVAGQVELLMGNRESAISSLRRYWEQAEDAVNCGEAALRLASAVERADVERLLQQIDDALGSQHQGYKAVARREELLLLRAKAVCNERLGQYRQAIDLHTAIGDQYASLQQKQGTGFSRAGFEQFLERLDDQVDALPSAALVKSDSAALAAIPVLIVGMPRCGSSLLHQMLSNHPEVAGAGELATLSLIQREWEERFALEPNALERHGPRWRNEYLSAIASRRGKGEKRYVIDKMPQNVFNVPLLKHLVPEAKIVHLVRTPTDMALSVLCHEFSEQYQFQHRIEDILAFTDGYWRFSEAHLRSENVIWLAFSDLLSSPHDTASKVLAALGLSFDNSVLTPEHNPRPLQTFSMHQTQQPIAASMAVARMTADHPTIRHANKIVSASSSLQRMRKFANPGSSSQ